MEQIPLVPLDRLRDVYETLADLMHPSRVIGVAVNSRLLDDHQAAAERERARGELQLPVCDVLRDGPDELVDAVLNLRGELIG